MRYTINVKTKAVAFNRHDPEHIPMSRNQFGDATPGYLRGWIKPNYPVPSIITETSIWRNCIMFFKDKDAEPFKMWTDK